MKNLKRSKPSAPPGKSQAHGIALEEIDPAAQYVEIWATHRAQSLFWRKAALILLLALLVTLGLFWSAATTYPEPMVVRVTEVGEAVPVKLHEMGYSYSAGDPVALYFLRRWIVDLNARQGEKTGPQWERALLFLAPDLRKAVQERDLTAVVNHVTDAQTGMNPEHVAVENLKLLISEASVEPYRAFATLDLVTNAMQRKGNRLEVERTQWELEIEFGFASPSRRSRKLMIENPLGLFVTAYAWKDVTPL